MSGFSVEDNKGVYGAKIKVIGVGGGGGNMVNHTIREGFDKVEMVVANTDAQALDRSLAKTKIQLGAMKTKGLGAGMNPDLGKEAAEESYDIIKDALEYSDIVFIASGFGGGTGTGAAPVVARAAKENKALAIGVVTTPFDFEGKKRMRLALEGIEELKKECDSIIIVSNQKLISLIDRKGGIKDCFKTVDNVLSRAVIGMSSIILDSGDDNINLDFADVKKVMSHRGLALMGLGVSEGDEAPQEALKDAIDSPLLNEMNIEGALGLLIHFKFHPDCPFYDITEAMTMARDLVHEEADIIFGTTYDETLKNNRVEVTLIATGFEEKKALEDNAKPEPTNEDIRKEHFERRLKKISGENFNSDDIYDELEKPSYYRNRMD
ncbi:cell division protein FtsZ [uncultured Campylobacter sp.]|uniref:cell division protein FtsZ n=1 Tax=uncultured Campylobacter sp. TaxID=218934 RepID=UPI00260D9A74|nr:cell division protein FtsZ [uncultured Campylobacter sp.]